MSDFLVRPLDPVTWPDFAALVERNKGVWGGCWCMGFHPEAFSPDGPVGNRARKQERVTSGKAHAALVYDGDTAVGWCQFGSPEELSRIKHRKEYESTAPSPPDWRITCFFVDKGTRHRGVAATALRGALELIASSGGGLVESYPEDAAGRKVSGSFLHNATLSLFEAEGFELTRRLGKNHWVVTKRVPPV